MIPFPHFHFFMHSLSLSGHQYARSHPTSTSLTSSPILLPRINSDHAQLFFMSLITNTLGGEPFGVSRPTKDAKLRELADKYFPTHWDKHGHLATHHRTAATNIYRCADGRFFHVHGSMDPAPTLRMLGLPVEPEVQPESAEEACWPVAAAVARFDSATLQRMASDEARQAGTICWSVDEYRASEHGRANAHVGLYEVDAFPNERQRPGWWPEYDDGGKLKTGPSRPLAGLKVVDLTRMVAAPATTRGLAELGASVMRVTSPNVTDHHGCFVDLNWGKWNTCLDFKNEEDRLKCVELIREADVVVTGYRPGVLDKYGFSYEGLFDICKDRDRGLIVVRENAYGWHGPWSYRSGWQQICDAVSSCPNTHLKE